ncbi:unnamed protein product [Camellia sinensis]
MHFDDELVNSEFERMAQAFAVGPSANSPLPLTSLVVQMFLDIQMWICFFLTSTGGHCFYISIRIDSGLYKLLFWCGKYQLSWHGRN